MALIPQALTTIQKAKRQARIALSNTADDDIFEDLINQASIQVEQCCNRVFIRADYDEFYRASGTQILQLNQYPIQTLTSIKDGGSLMTPGDDYSTYPDYYAKGMVYKERGWVGIMLIRGLTGDPFTSEYTYEASYTAGFYLPNDVTVLPALPHYVAGDPASLPFDLVMCVAQMVAESYLNIVRGAQGVSMHKEGGISDTFTKRSAAAGDIEFTGGLDAQYAQILNRYKRVAVG